MKYEVNWSQYLESICTDEKYLGWQDFYTPTDALHRQRSEKKLAPRRLNLSLMVQTITPPKKEVPGEEKAEKEQVERLEVLAGLRKYADNHVLLVGKPGSGKSTALERLLWEEAEKAKMQPQEKIPVLVELRRYKTSVLGIIGDFLFQHRCRLNEAEIEQLLLAGRFLLLVDGWNEVPDDKARGDVKNFREKYQRLTPMIFTTRELAGDIGIEKKLEMQPLTEEQMRQFVLTYLPEEGERLLQQLQGRLRELGETPLLLWMLCELFKITGHIPPNLGLVFRCFAQSYDSQIKLDVSTDESRSRWFLLLQHLAFEMMRGKTATDLLVTIPKQEAEDILTDFLTTNQFDKPRECAFNWLNDLLKYHLIQLTNSNREIEFHHQLLQEYYAAESLLVQLPQLSDDTLKRNYLNYLKWTEALALMLALVEDEELALRVVKLALEVDLQLGARLAGEVKLEFQEKTVDLVVKLEIYQDLKVKLLGLTHSEKAVPALSNTLNDKNYYVRKGAAESLENIANAAKSPIFNNNLNDEEYYVRLTETRSLKQIFFDRIGFYRFNFYHDQRQYGYNEYKEYCFTTAIETLENIANSNEEPVTALIKALNNKNSYVRTTAAEALLEIANEAAIPALIEALNDKNYYVRTTAAEALGNLANEAAVPALIKALKDRDYNFRKTVAEALANLANEAAVPVLIKALNDENYHVSVRAAKALGKIANEAAVPALIKALNDNNYYVRAQAGKALGKIANEAAVSALIKALNDNNYYVRKELAKVLGNIGSPELLIRLTPYLKTKNALNALEAITGIQNRCKYYNYKIYTSPALEEKKPSDTPSVQMIFHKEVYGAAGIVQGNQIINSLKDNLEKTVKFIIDKLTSPN